MRWLNLILHCILLTFAQEALCIRLYKLRDPVSYYGFYVDQQFGFEQSPQPQQYKWTEEWYEDMPIDHFAYTDPRVFNLRYLINTEYFHRKNAPIFFYTGNEGGIEGFAENTGFMWDIAEEFGAAVVFAEHRYYGKTQPFGNDSYKSVSNLGYLSSEQALADFAQLITFLKQKRLPNAKNSPVIAFGGSYGGMLSAWGRIKYPHLISGAIAASAPVFWFKNVPVPPVEAYDRIVTRTFRLEGCNSKSVIASFEAIRELAKTDTGRAYLNVQFHLDEKSLVKSPGDGDALVGAVRDVMETMAMVDYPYPANFLAPLPAWPVKAACKYFTSKPKKSVEDSAIAAYGVLNVFFNTSGQAKTLCVFGNQCVGPFAALGDPLGWPWQACTEMVMPMCSTGPPQSFFDKTCPYKESGLLDGCKETFGSMGFDEKMFRSEWAIENYGAQYPMATNIVFSNGYLDPWSGGGWQMKPYTQGSLVSLIVEDGAHHYDLRGAHPNDTESVKEVRRLEVLHIRRWISEGEELAKQAKKEHRSRIHQMLRI